MFPSYQRRLRLVTNRSGLIKGGKFGKRERGRKEEKGGEGLGGGGGEGEGFMIVCALQTVLVKS